MKLIGFIIIGFLYLVLLVRPIFRWMEYKDSETGNMVVNVHFFVLYMVTIVFSIVSLSVCLFTNGQLSEVFQYGSTFFAILGLAVFEGLFKINKNKGDNIGSEDLANLLEDDIPSFSATKIGEGLYVVNDKTPSYVYLWVKNNWSEEWEMVRYIKESSDKNTGVCGVKELGGDKKYYRFALIKTSQFAPDESSTSLLEKHSTDETC